MNPTGQQTNLEEGHQNITGRNAAGLTVVVNIFSERQSSAPPALCGHIFPNAVALILRLERQPKRMHGDRPADGNATGDANRALPVGGWAYGMPRNLKRFDEILRPVIMPAARVITVCVG